MEMEERMQIFTDERKREWQDIVPKILIRAFDYFC